jgi:hypothetical protein
VQKITAGPRQHSRSWYRTFSGLITIFLLFPVLLRVLKWGLLFDERRGLISPGHSSLAQSSKSMLGFASAVVLSSGPVGTNHKIFILSGILRSPTK